MSDTKLANILLAHGSTDPQWAIPFQNMANVIQQRMPPGDDRPIVKLAYMELCEPSLEDTCAELSQAGYRNIHIYPVFFAAGKHLRIDVPKQLAAIENEIAIKTTLHPPIGQDPLVQTAITEVILNKL